MGVSQKYLLLVAIKFPPLLLDQFYCVLLSVTTSTLSSMVCLFHFLFIVIVITEYIVVECKLMQVELRIIFGIKSYGLKVQTNSNFVVHKKL